MPMRSDHPVWESEENEGRFSIRELLEICGSNMKNIDKIQRIKLLNKINQNNLKLKINSVGDLAAVIQILITKLSKRREEEEEEEDELVETLHINVIENEIQWERAASNNSPTESEYKVTRRLSLSKPIQEPPPQIVQISLNDENSEKFI